MECAVIVTYRCNTRCQLCYTWKNPSKIEEEITPEIIDKIPGGQVSVYPANKDNLNIANVLYIEF